MNIQEFEKQAKRQLSQSKAQVDIDNLLIDLHLKKKRSYKLYAFVGSALLAIVLFSGFMYHTWTNDTHVDRSDTFYSDVAIDKNVTPITEGSQNLNKTDQITNLSSASEEDIVATLPIESDAENTVTEAAINIQISESMLYTPASDDTSAGNDAPADFTSAVADHLENSTSSDVLITTSIHTSEGTLDHPSDFKEEKILNDTEVGEAFTLRATIPSLTALEETSTNILENTRPHVSLPFSLKPQDCPSFKARSWFFALVPEIGYEHHFKSLSTTNAMHTDVLNERKNSESTLEGLQAGLSLMAYRPNGFYVKGGLSYSTFTERMNLERTYTEMDTTVGIVSITESQSGDTLTVIYGDIISSTTVSEKRVIHYNFKMIDIPVAIGYSFYLNNHGFDIEGGVLFNIKTSASGQLYSEGMDFANLDDEDLFKQSLGIGYFGSINYRRDLRNGSSLFIGPRIKIRPKQYSSSSNPVVQKYTSLGLHAGYIFRF